MTEAEADTVLQAEQVRMTFAQLQCIVTVDQTVWVLGFVEGAPYQRAATGRMTV
jgi:hypothetical protein